MEQLDCSILEFKLLVYHGRLEHLMWIGKVVASIHLWNQKNNSIAVTEQLDIKIFQFQTLLNFLKDAQSNQLVQLTTCEFIAYSFTG